MVSRAIVNGEDYTIWRDHVDRPRLIRARSEGTIRCICRKPLTFVDSTIKIPHFRHLQGNCLIIGAERDTETHNEGLEYLGQLLRKNLDGVVEKEHTFRVPDGLRRTDIFAKLKDRKTICYELQCSPTSETEFEDRTVAYKKLGHKVVWILGPDVSGLRIKTHVTNDLFEGVLTTVKRLAFTCLVMEQYLTLYFPTLDEKLWIAYCTDRNFERTRNITFSKGEKQFVVQMPEVKLALFTAEFGRNGLPYIRNFPPQELLKPSKRLQAVYAREMIHLGIARAVPELSRKVGGSHRSGKSRKAKGRAKSAPSVSKTISGLREVGIPCSLCSTGISDQHYHRCDKCASILCDTCTKKIENDLKQPEHNLTGQVRHCDWLASSKSVQ
jgi:hypothetical protein